MLVHRYVNYARSEEHVERETEDPEEREPQIRSNSSPRPRLITTTGDGHCRKTELPKEPGKTQGKIFYSLRKGNRISSLGRDECSDGSAPWPKLARFRSNWKYVPPSQPSTESSKCFFFFDRLKNVSRSFFYVKCRAGMEMESRSGIAGSRLARRRSGGRRIQLSS